MQVANSFTHLIQQLDGPGRDPVGLSDLVRLVMHPALMLYRIDFKLF